VSDLFVVLEVRGENEQKTDTNDELEATEKPGNSAKLTDQLGSYAFN